MARISLYCVVLLAAISGVAGGQDLKTGECNIEDNCLTYRYTLFTFLYNRRYPFPNIEVLWSSPSYPEHEEDIVCFRRSNSRGEVICRMRCHPNLFYEIDFQIQFGIPDGFNAAEYRNILVDGCNLARDSEEIEISANYQSAGQQISEIANESFGRLAALAGQYPELDAVLSNGAPSEEGITEASLDSLNRALFRMIDEDRSLNDLRDFIVANRQIAEVISRFGDSEMARYHRRLTIAAANAMIVSVGGAYSDNLRAFNLLSTDAYYYRENLAVLGNLAAQNGISRGELPDSLRLETIGVASDLYREGLADRELGTLEDLTEAHRAFTRPVSVYEGWVNG